jgi:signal transduction histidine kinase
MPAADAARRPRRYRRQLRSRIILSFVLLGFGLTALFAYAVDKVRNQVEDKLVVDLMNRNIDLYAQQYAQDPQNPSLPVDQMRAFAFTPDKFGSVRENQPQWYELPDGIHGLGGVDDSGQPFSYKLAVRKTPQVWFFLAYDMTQTIRGQEQFNRGIYGAVVVFTLLSLLVGWWAASRVMSPVSELANRLKKSSGRSTTPVSLAAHFPNDEVGQLAAALDDYAARLTEVVQRDREFNADVSHELRTPLAVIRGATELLLSRPELDDRMQARLRRIQRAEQQCTDLISALLLLSRNERGHGVTDVGKVAEQLLDVHRAQLGGKPLVLRMEGEGGLIVDAPEAAVAVALGNLIGNAVKYTHEGEVVVRMHPDAAEVIDSGPGLSEEEAARLFERGYRGTHAEHSQGAGIGLSIVRRLCALYGWDVRVVPGTERGVIATLRFGMPGQATAPTLSSTSSSQP